jgi:hypothetical protein
VRGYGLVDSPKVTTERGQTLNLTAVIAPNLAAAAQYYPAVYWAAMISVPDRSRFPGTGANGNGIPIEFKTQDTWLNRVKTNGCGNCHQIGNYATRTIPEAFGHFDSSIAAWARRLQSGPAGGDMSFFMGGLLTPDGGHLAALADWTDRIKAGEIPSATPPRPLGIERNIVITVRDWGDPKHYLHDLTATDRRKPTVNAYGLIYGAAELSTDNLPVLDPVRNTKTVMKVPLRDPKDAPTSALNNRVRAASAYFGMEQTWDSQVNAHNPMMDQDGRIYYTAQIRSPKSPPDYCKRDSGLRSAQLYPLDTPQNGFVQNSRQVTVFDPRTKKFSHIDTCFGNHLQFGFDKDHTLWTSGGGQLAGWLDTEVFDGTGNAEKAQGWAPFVLDTTGTGHLVAYTKPGEPLDPKKDMMLAGSGTYAVMPSPVDGSVWFTVNIFAGQGGVVRFDPKTRLSEFYKVPAPGFGPRGGDIDSQGVVWVSLASGHLASFDRSKCKGPLNGPNATGDQCPEGWSFHKYPGPGFAGIGDNSAEASYYSWVDQHDAVGLGKDVPISTGNENDGFDALVNGKMIVLRIPYPIGFYAKGLDARIDDANAGWKGRGLWTSSGDRVPWLQEGGKGMMPMAVHFQLRPDPLAH